MLQHEELVCLYFYFNSIESNFNHFKIDVDDIQVVINFDYPLTTEDYVHRIGRTGRRNNTGTAFTFFTDEDRTHSSDLIQVLRESGQEVPQQLLELSKFSDKNSNRRWGYEPRKAYNRDFRNRRFDGRIANDRFSNEYGNNRFSGNFNEM